MAVDFDTTVTETPTGEKHPKEVQEALQQIVADFTAAEKKHRLALIRRVSKQRAFYKGDPVGWFDPELMTWRPPETAPNYNEETAPLSRYNVNIYQAVGLILMSSIASSGLPGTVFLPQNPNDPADISVARQGKTILDFIAGQQDMFSVWCDMHRLFYTDGPVLAYIRHVRDGSRYGFREVHVPQITPAVIGAPGFECPECKGFTPEERILAGDMGGKFCPLCGMPVAEENFRSGYQTLAPTGYRSEREPNGMEIVDIFGVLETRLPWWVKDLSKAPYAAIEVEVHHSTLLKQFWKRFEEIEKAETSETEDKAARGAALSPIGSQGTLQSSMGMFGEEGLWTYRRWWLRPETFYQTKDEGLAKEMEAEYPEGCLAQFAGDTFLDANGQQMENALVLAKPLPADSIYCPSQGESMIPIQEALNTAFNLQIESMEYAAFAPILADQELISKEMPKKKMRPAEWTFVEVPPNKTLEGSVWQPQIKEASRAVQIVIEEAFKWAEYLAGAQPALFGASVTNIRTNAAYMTARNQALGRLSISWQQAKNAWAEIQGKIVASYAKHRNREENFALFRPGSAEVWEPKNIAIVQGGKIHARAESNETIPATFSQKQAGLQMMLQTPNPVLQGILGDPYTLESIFQFLGIPEIEVPGRALREKYLRVIQTLLQEPPKLLVNPNNPDVPTVESSLAFDPVLDQAAIALRVIQEWAASEEAEAIKSQNQDGYANVIAYAQAAFKSIAPPPTVPTGEAGKQGPNPSAAEPGEQPAARIEDQAL